MGSPDTEPGHRANEGPVHQVCVKAFNLGKFVSEWVEDCYVENYKKAPEDGIAVSIKDCTHHVVRGGSWNHSPDDVRAA
jgi:formylglycine-generating enzyme required for sulfatase activity